MKKLDLSLYLVTDRKLARGRAIEDVVQEALDGGVTLLQIREKHAPTKDFLALAHSIKSLTDEAKVPLIINDRIDIALAVGAAGVHLGQEDMPIAVARKLLGPEAIIGISVTNIEQAKIAQDSSVDYVGVGPIYFTLTKEEARKPIGCDGLSAVRSIISHPIVAIGGLNKDNIAGVIEAGADGIAVVSAIVAADTPQAATQQLLNTVRKLKAGSVIP